MRLGWFIFLIPLTLCSCNDDPLVDDVSSEKSVALNEIYLMINTTDKGFLIAGEHDSKSTFIKTDLNFATKWRNDNYEWGHNYSAPGWGGAFYQFTPISIFQDDQSNYICIGVATEGGDVIQSSTLIIKLAWSGKEIDKTTIPNFAVADALPTSDGYLLMGGTLICLDRNLDIKWEREFTDQDHWATKITSRIEGGYAVTGIFESNNIFLKKLDENGGEVELQENHYNKAAFNDAAYDLIQLPDRGFLIAGRTRKTIGAFDTDGYFLRTNSAGDTLWTRRFGGASNEWLHRIAHLSKNSFLIQGTDGFPSDDVIRSILLEVDENGQITHSIYTNKIEILIQSPLGYFAKAYKEDVNSIRLSKIFPDQLFN